MSFSNSRILFALAILTSLFSGLSPCRAQSKVSRVIPSLEIEILDPNRDARGNPAVVLKNDEFGNQQVDIPPTLIVHRYYYTGDRSFRGPDMPGGPCIIVAHHPKTGEKLYLPIQMLPGSAEVKYTAKGIEYDYGDRAVIVSFPRIGDPIVSYRNGKTIQHRLADTFHVKQISDRFGKTGETIGQAGSKASVAGSGLVQASKEVFRPFTLPMQNLSRLIPGAAALSDPNLSAKIQEEQALSNRDREIQRAKCLNASKDIDIPRR